MIRVAISGGTGNVGRALAAAVQAADDLELAGLAAPSLGVSLTELLQNGADVAVDFSVPDAAAAACETAIGAGVPLVLGTTGLAPDDLARQGDQFAGRGIQLLQAANFAVGAILMMRFAEEAARLMDRCEIVELHATQSAMHRPERRSRPPRGSAATRRSTPSACPVWSLTRR